MESTVLEDLMQQRREKLRWLIEQGIEPYPARCALSCSVGELINRADESLKNSPDEIYTVAGRLMSLRVMGKASFCHIQDSSGRIQIYLKQEVIGETGYQVFKKGIDIGDWVGVKGSLFRTRTGELTVNVKEMFVLSKSLRPLPEKWHGLKDVEVRYRQRYVDLIANSDVKDIFIKRSKIINSVRNTLVRIGFLEVETPQLQRIPGGALAKPFKTFHNALDSHLYMRVAPELYLKRLLVGGFEKVFEIGRCFRNEGIDTRHNPEFTMLEAYSAFTDYNGVMKLAEEIFANLMKDLNLPEKLKYRGKEFSAAVPFKKASVSELFERYAREKLNFPLEMEQLRDIARKHNIQQEPDTPLLKIYDHIFDSLIAPNLVEPVFVKDFPREFSPLAKSLPGDKNLAERFELYIAGEEVANAYSELNDPIEQGRILLDQAKSKSADPNENEYDYDYIRALEYGMPPAGGLGIGIDRLVMVLSGADSIREVLFFPLLRQEK